MASMDTQDPHGDIPELLMPWFNAEHEEIYGRATPKGEGVLMGCPLWGREYIERWAYYSLPTLLAPRNQTALRDRCRLVLFIPRAARPMLHRLTRGAANAGIDVIFRDIPDNVLNIMSRDYGARFRALGLVGNVLTHMAGRAGMGCHMYQPDQAYSHRYFENLLRLGELHRAIIHMGFNVNVDSAADEIEQYRIEGGALVFPDRELGDLGFRHMHPQCWLHSMNAAKIPDKLPASHRLWWQGRDVVYFYSAHVHPAWLAPELCIDSPVAFTSTLDTLLPEYIPPNADGRPEFYVPTVDDGMVYVELSGADKPANRPYIPLADFCGDYWRNSSFGDAYRPYFAQAIPVPIKPQASFLTDEEIRRQHALISAELDASQDRIGIEWLKSKFSTRFQKAALHAAVLGANG
jgi:hypothetical protein